MANEDKKLSKDLFQPIELSQDLGEELSRPELSYWKDAWIRLRKNKGAIAGLIVLSFIVFMALVGPMMNKYSFDEAHYDAKNLPPRIAGLEWLGFNGYQTFDVQGTTVEEAIQAGLEGNGIGEEFLLESKVLEEPSEENNNYYTVEMLVDIYNAKGVEANIDDYSEKDLACLDDPECNDVIDISEQYYWFGTDDMGRDLWTRIWKGTQISLYIGLLAAIIDMVIGVLYGGISGYYGGRVDNYMQRIIEILTGIPNLVVVILMIIVLEPGLMAITLALTITGWTGMARIVRGQVLKLKGQEFVLAARTLGSNDRRILLKHLIPNVTGMIVINTMFTIPNAIFFESFLSFIGLGLQAPIASLGTLIDSAFESYRVYPYMLLYPAIIISLLMIGFNILADGLRDALDPKMRK